VQQLFRGLARLGVPLCTLVLLAHCGGGDLTLPSETAPADLVLVDGNNQNGPPGERLTLPLVVRVTDRRGEPVRGQRVAFALATAAPGGIIDPDTTESVADGTARTRWTLGNVSGTQRVVARVVGLDGVEVGFDAVVGTGGAVRIEMVDGDDKTAAVGTALDDSLVVRVLDGFGNPVAGVEVVWEADQGSVDPGSVTTGADGRAATYRILGSSAGTQTATATSSGLTGSPVTFTSHAAPGTADELVRVSGDDQSAEPGAELPAPLVVRLVDRDGNAVPDRAVSWVVGAGGGHVDSPNSNTGDNGEASTRWTLGSAGTNTLNAVVSGVGVVPFVAHANGGGGGGGGGGGDAEPARLEFLVQPSNTREDREIDPPVEVVVLDRDGNRVTSREIEVKLDLIGERDGKLKGDRHERTESGVARFSDLEIERDGDYRLRASADGLPSVDSDEFEIHDD
jgi:Big-like domain-containing protein